MYLNHRFSSSKRRAGYLQNFRQLSSLYITSAVYWLDTEEVTGLSSRVLKTEEWDFKSSCRTHLPLDYLFKLHLFLSTANTWKMFLFLLTEIIVLTLVGKAPELTKSLLFVMRYPGTSCSEKHRRFLSPVEFLLHLIGLGDKSVTAARIASCFWTRRQSIEFYYKWLG